MLTAIIAVFGVAVAAALRLVPLAGSWATRLGFVGQSSPDGPTHRREVPLLGGAAVAACVLPVLVWAALTDGRWGYALGGFSWLIGLGAFKDRVERPVSSATQLVVQFLASGLLVAGGFRARLLSDPALDDVLTIGLSVAVLNAWNFVDVSDGLAGALFLSGLPLLIALSWADMNAAAALVAAALAGGLSGFLRYNWFPARIFMGDVGSFGVGYLINVLILETIGRGHSPVLSATPVALPALDLVFACVTRILAGRSPFRGGKEHIPLRLLARGWSSARLAITASLLSIVICAAAYLLTR
jgi:UDP-GlcNAc:undecaprenyl-phosphate/decaprenyl-phosphate GlcNAc-1-phosphate transferase